MKDEINLDFCIEFSREKSVMFWQHKGEDLPPPDKVNWNLKGTLKFYRSMRGMLFPCSSLIPPLNMSFSLKFKKIHVHRCFTEASYITSGVILVLESPWWRELGNITLLHYNKQMEDDVTGTKHWGTRPSYDHNTDLTPVVAFKIKYSFFDRLPKNVQHNAMTSSIKAILYVAEEP